MLSSKSMVWLSEMAEKVTQSSRGILGNEEEQEQEEFEKKCQQQKDELYSRYEMHDQQHVFNHWDELSNEQKVALLAQLKNMKVEEIKGYLKLALQEQGGLQPNGFYDLGVAAKEDVKPFSGKVTSTTKDAKYLKKTCEKLGLDAIRSNKVGAILLAGGQGTRLGFDGPKGQYDIGMPSKRSLFCLIAERILKLTHLAGNEIIDGSVHIPLYIMTSPMNHDTTKEYFESNKYFGLPPNDVNFFSQGTLPCLSRDGKIIMENQFQCAMAPDGNGGIYPAMERCGVLDDMKNRGIEHIHTFSVDNALVKPADPLFIGYCIDEKADCGNKVLWKESAHEKVGVIAERGGKACVIEYSELSRDMAGQTKGIGRKKKLVYGAANICNHYYSISFLEKKVWPNQGKYYHIANKKIACWDASKKETVTPTENNGIKLETFIFDVFPLSTNMAILEVERDDEFAPVKNAPGSQTDSPDTAREKLSNLAKKWLRDAGATLHEKEEGKMCEIAPWTSYGGEGLGGYKKETIDCPFSL